MQPSVVIGIITVVFILVLSMMGINIAGFILAAIVTAFIFLPDIPEAIRWWKTTVTKKKQ